MDTKGTISKEQHEKDLNTLREKYKPNNAFSVPIGSDLDFFKWWCVFLRPFVPLTDRETDVVASFLKQRHELSKSISDPGILDAMVMNDDTKAKVAEESNISKQHFYVVMNSLKKKNVIRERINPRLIPNVKDDNVFKLAVVFKKEKEQ